MTKSSRFGGFLKPAEGAAVPEPVVEPAASPVSPVVPAPAGEAEDGPYLLRRFPKEEAVARLGNGVRASSKYRLEDYVRELKRDGWPATEARVTEAMFELLDEDAAFRTRVRDYLIGRT